MKQKNVKIVATLGPASHSEEMIMEFAKAGVDVFRINLSHATISEIAERVEWIRNTGKKLKKPLEILGDLPGAKIRIGDMAPNVVLEQGQKFNIFKEARAGDVHGCSINHPEIFGSILPGAEVFIDDGNIKLVVTKTADKYVETVVQSGGLLKSRKGFSAVGISLGYLEVSPTDKDAILLMIGHGADMIAVSFVETEKDIIGVRKLLPKNSKIKIIAKIETIKGVKNAKKILEVSEGLMIARGDLGLAVPLVQVPHIQKELIKLCNREGKFVITATQMLESMIVKPMPTRAEVSDVANAVLDGTDATMLSAESAEGKYPLETVQMMEGIIVEALKHV